MFKIIRLGIVSVHKPDQKKGAFRTKKTRFVDKFVDILSVTGEDAGHNLFIVAFIKKQAVLSLRCWLKQSPAPSG